jgi:uncharacterized protein with HEPN domain
MHEDDRIRLRHMLEMAQFIQSTSPGKTRASLDEDMTLQLALTRAVEIIGEAASQVSDELRQSLPQIPWGSIIGMRNWLIHAYFNINLDILWNTITESVPSLTVELERLLQSEPEDSE